MLRSLMYLGEIHFGELHNTEAHEAIVKDRGLFERVQRRTVRPTRAGARRAGSRSARRTRRSNAPTRISMTRSGSSASLACWAGPRARRPWRNSPRPSMTRTPSGPAVRCHEQRLRRGEDHHSPLRQARADALVLRSARPTSCSPSTRFPRCSALPTTRTSSSPPTRSRCWDYVRSTSSYPGCSAGWST